jgi:hypothetical protein
VNIPSTRTRRGPLIVLLVAFVALLAVPTLLAIAGDDEGHDAAGAAGTTTEVPTSVDPTTTSEPATTTTGSAPTTTETTAVPVPETTTTTVDMAAVYDYAAELERAKATPPPTTPPTSVVRYVEVPVEVAPEPEPVVQAEAVPTEPTAEAPAQGDPFAGLSWSDRQFLECVKNRESRGDYGAVNPSSGAGGAYQFLRNTWNNTASHAGRHDLVGLPAQYATPYDQDFIAAHLLQWYGRSPWSYSC